MKILLQYIYVKYNTRTFHVKYKHSTVVRVRKYDSNIYSNITVQVHRYYTAHDILGQEFVYDFDDITSEFTSGTILTNCCRDSREMSWRAGR